MDNMLHPQNQIEYVKLRRYSNRLVMSGIGIMILGIWESIRMVMNIYLQRYSIWQFLKEQLPEISDGLPPEIAHKTLLIIFCAFVIIIFLAYLFSLILHLYMGMSAIADGRQRKKKFFYLLLAVMIICLSFFSQKSTDQSLTADKTEAEQNLDTAFATDLLDITLCLTCAEMIYCAARMRLLKRKINNMEAMKGAQ